MLSYNGVIVNTNQLNNIYDANLEKDDQLVIPYLNGFENQKKNSLLQGTFNIYCHGLKVGAQKNLDKLLRRSLFHMLSFYKVNLKENHLNVF